MIPVSELLPGSLVCYPTERDLVVLTLRESEIVNNMWRPVTLTTDFIQKTRIAVLLGPGYSVDFSERRGGWVITFRYKSYSSCTQTLHYAHELQLAYYVITKGKELRYE